MTAQAETPVVHARPALRDPFRLIRSLVRGREVAMVILGALVGIGSGLSVALIGTISSGLHDILFGVRGERLSGVAELPRGYWVPILGGAIIGTAGVLWSSRRPSTPVDPIEANALHGGRMSLRDSVWVTVQTLISNGFGASVGLEAGYAQMGAGLASKLGVALRLRRNDLRILVGCGAGGAIGAAFGAPLTGAFYAFELIVGTYSVANVAPILAASVAGVLTTRALRAVSYAITMPPAAKINFAAYPSTILIGILCALFGIAIMRAVYYAERGFDWSRLPKPVRPAIAGMVMMGLAVITPQVLAAGHGALRVDVPAKLTIAVLISLICLKSFAAVITLGSGFRGGLFFASLFLGALLGKLFAAVAVIVAPHLSIDPTLCILAGMSALAVAVIGGPLTMGFLVLETTGDFGVTTVVLAACVVSGLMVRETFGYSFSTWRLHLRGETIRSAIDVGWMRSLTVGRMMRKDPATIQGSATLAELRRSFPLGSTERVVVVDDDHRYLGIALTIEAYTSVEDDPDKDAKTTCADVAHWKDAPLTPEMNVRDAMKQFERTESEALAVVETLETRKLLGMLTEGYALRRYAEELDKARQGLAGG
jgi:CIC family chloride channel protein